MYLYNLAVVFLSLRQPRFPAPCPCLLHLRLREVPLGEVEDVADAQVAPEDLLRAVAPLPILRQTPLSHLLFKHSWLGKLANFLLVFIVECLDEWVLLGEGFRANADDREAGCPVEVVLEVAALFGIGEVVASGEERRNLAVMLVEAAVPEVFAQACLRGELAVVRVVVVEVPRQEVRSLTFEVADVEPDVEA